MSIGSRRVALLASLAGGLVLLVLDATIEQPEAAPTREHGPAEQAPARTERTIEAASPFAPFVGLWQRRDAWLWVLERGTARLVWRTDWCEPGSIGPCDRFESRGLVIGAHADMVFMDIAEGPHATVRGRVVALNKERPLHLGAVTLRRLAEDLVVLNQGDWNLELCRPPRDLNFCDAPG